jgi:hypothetical protein
MALRSEDAICTQEAAARGTKIKPCRPHCTFEHIIQGKFKFDPIPVTLTEKISLPHADIKQPHGLTYLETRKTKLQFNCTSSWGIAGVILQSLQLQKVTSASLCWCHKGEWVNSRRVRHNVFLVVGAVEVPVFVCLGSSYNHVTEVEGT